MSYQLIRGAIEMATASALVDAGIDKVFFDNVAYAAPDAERRHLRRDCISLLQRSSRM